MDFTGLHLLQNFFISTKNSILSHLFQMLHLFNEKKTLLACLALKFGTCRELNNKFKHV